ncbi:ketoacyl-ACP synthase III [Flavitalea sp. BT771]|uniref:3-oxoacyl-ACP synthase III family protein n=1 Tax=Flavitalea sp. BT771 TaxID=3063329 RepID=UPI0026E4176C|nr:ketoacyl-ACP synthase III [Flavitalea sp. BT771]MDO6432805.1 ketoacyl-ACP synthase III [Flavitalea sp. BT771]MDV6221919.1 ketoacyl-ACP synthase III [Flavitalea sp. BT771]
MHRSIITGSGSYIPELIVKNSDFLNNTFYSEEGALLDSPTDEIITKFSKITGIRERRYSASSVPASQMAAMAAEEAILNSKIDRESIDQLIVAHNFGDICGTSGRTDLVPSLASRVKKILGITNPSCIPYDLIFGCPGWLQGIIQADAFFKAGMAKKALVIGAETLSRVVDQHDRDGMIFSDGAGACTLEYNKPEHGRTGILSAKVRSDCGEETTFIRINGTYKPSSGHEQRYIKMKGRKVYEYALRHVPLAMKDCLDAAGIAIDELKAIFIHQANEKMDEAIVKSFYALYGVTEVPHHVMPMTIQWLGNSSVATIPTLFDLVSRGKMTGFQLNRGDVVIFASVGAGMNINAICYGCN